MVLSIFVVFALFRGVLCFRSPLCYSKISPSYYPADSPAATLSPAVRLRAKIHNRARELCWRLLPSPHSELVLGMVIGVDDFHRLPQFKDMLISTGVIHVVVVSGFNINVVSELVGRLIGSTYKLRNLLLSLATTLGYAFLTGFDPPVVRSWVMISILHLGKYHGRALEQVPLLIFTASILGIITPKILFSLSFQLSFVSTLGLVLFETPVSRLLKKFSAHPGVLLADLSSTVAAQLLVWPIISYSFGRVSLFSPLVNMLVLWVVSFTTLLGGLFIVVGFFSLSLARIISFPVYFLLDYFVQYVTFFGNAGMQGLALQVGVRFLVIYYAFLFLLLKFFPRGHVEE
jgi:competence protein ComEC